LKKRLEAETNVELTGYVSPHQPPCQQRKTMRWQLYCLERGC